MQGEGHFRGYIRYSGMSNTVLKHISKAYLVEIQHESIEDNTTITDGYLLLFSSLVFYRLQEAMMSPTKCSLELE